MSRYTGTPAIVDRPIEAVFDRLSSLDTFSQSLENLPQEAKDKIGDVRFEPDAIIINTPQVGELRLEVVERVRPERIVLGAVGSPVPASIIVDMKSLRPESTELTPAMEVEIPAMVRPFVGPKLQQAANQFGAMIAKLAMV